MTLTLQERSMTITTEEAEALASHIEKGLMTREIREALAALRTLAAERDTAVNAARLAAQIGHEWKDRAERAEAARDEAISRLSAMSHELGEAEGKLAASEMAGVVQGWKERAERAEAEVERLRGALANLLEAHESGWVAGADWGAATKARAALEGGKDDDQQSN